jgi:hypothetical protein
MAQPRRRKGDVEEGLRNIIEDSEESASEGSFDDFPVELVGREIGEERRPTRPTKILGMNAAERMIVSILLFVVTLILGAGLLLITGRIAF